MKKAFALLLSLVLLLTPVLSLAEAAVQVTVTVQADETALAEYLLAAGVYATAEDAQGLAKPLAKLLGDTKLLISGMGSGMLAEMYIQDELILDMGAVSSFASTEVFTQTLLPGHALVEVLAENGAELEEKYVSALSRVNWMGLLTDLLKVGEDWAKTVDSDVEYGAFIGDAYLGGASQFVTWFDDRDLAVLGQMLADVLEQRIDLPDDVMTVFSGDDSMLRDMETMLKDMSVKNGHSYVLKSVYDANDMDVGYSLTAYEGSEQVCTVSAGIVNGDDLLIVWGYGHDGRVYYVDCTIDIPMEEPTDEATMNATVNVYEDTQRVGYRACAANEDARVWQWYANFTFALNEMGLPKHFALIMRAEGNGVSDCCTANGEWAEDGLLDVTAHLYGNDAVTPYAVITLDSAEVDMAPISTAGLTPINISELEDPEVDAQMQQVIQEAASALLIKLFKVVPAEFVRMLMSF